MNNFSLYVRLPNLKIRHTPSMQGIPKAVLAEGVYPIQLYQIIEDTDTQTFWACITYKEYEKQWILLRRKDIVFAFLAPQLTANAAHALVLFQEIEKLQQTMLDTCEALKESLKEFYK